MFLLIELLFYKLLIYLRINNGDKGIVVLKFDGLGDLVIMLNALNRFIVPHKLLPLILVTKSNFVDVAKIYGFFDEVIGVDENKFKRNILYRFLIYKKIRNTFPQSIINPVYSNIVSSYTDLIVAAVAPRYRFIGPTYSSKSYFGKMIRYVKQSVYNITIENKDLNLHELNHNIQLFLSIGMQLRYNDQDFMTPRTNQLSGNKMESKFVLIAPGSNNPVKNWEVEKYLEVAIELDKLGHIVKFIGTKSDLIGIKIPESLRDKIEVYSNGLNLKDLFSLISKSDLVISNDSSASHIAEFFKVRYLVISWGVFKGRYFPYPDSLNTSRVIYSQQCLNCGDFCKDSRINAKCLRAISVNEVLKQVNILLN